MSIIYFKSKLDLDIEDKLARIKQLRDAKSAELEKQKIEWILIDRQGFIKIIDGHRNYPKIYRLPLDVPITLSVQTQKDNLEIINHGAKNFYLYKINKDGVGIYYER